MENSARNSVLAVVFKRRMALFVSFLVVMVACSVEVKDLDRGPDPALGQGIGMGDRFA